MTRDSIETTNDAELLLDIKRAEQQVAFTEVELEDAKEVAKMKREAFDLAVSEMRSIIKGSDAPLFDVKTGEVKEG